VKALVLRLVDLCFVGLVFASAGQSGVLFTLNDASLVSGDPTQLGRLNRNGIPSDWSAPKAFPGVVNPTTSYHYHMYVVPVISTPFIQISIDDPNPNTFASAYLNTYVPTSLNTNYLGDPGQSGNFFGVDPQFFQVIVPEGNSLIVVVNDPSATGLGVGEHFNLLVEGFVDTNFDEVPEPGTALLIGGGMVLVGLMRVRHRSRERHGERH
jgi:hypothetical protein